MRSRVALFLGVPAVLVTAAAFAQSPPAAAPAAKPAATATASAKPASSTASTAAPSTGPRKDPEGRKGLSPYTEAVVRGQNSFVARDFAGAVTAFQDAIKTDPQQMLGFYLLGEAQLEAGKPEEAEAAWTTGLSKKGTDDLNAKLLFLMADLRERQKDWTKAKDAWAAYAAFLTGHPQVKGYAATAEERQKRIDQRVKDEKDYAAVKERIKKREEERLKEAEENAKKDKLNK
ncbi:MAG: tetratricopeptide repeat protein [Polyangiaceae bacterium]|nr:tetratricopeptide repeat protein [Polyangiaceae bacterium]